MAIREAKGPGVLPLFRGMSFNASAEELMRLPGIGQATAEAILADRAANGPYAAPEDLTRVKGISQRMEQQWGSDITVGG